MTQPAQPHRRKRRAASPPGKSIAHFVQTTVLAVHRRNGGRLRRLDPGLRLLAPELRLDSLDLAEVVVVLERRYAVRLFEAAQPPRTWAELVTAIEHNSLSSGVDAG